MKKLVILVGPPGSGKSTLAASRQDDVVYINQDTQGRDHIALFLEAVTDGKHIIVDRMNFNKSQRERYLKAGKDAGYHTVICVLHESRQTCLERCISRKEHPAIENIDSANAALNTFFSKYERPLSDEADEVSYIYPSTAKSMAIVCDLDGTLCDIDHRLHHVKNDKKDWKSFFEGIPYDQPNQWCAAILKNMSDSYPIVYASGRSNDYRDLTEGWLSKASVPMGNHLFMRPRNDSRSDSIVKEIILDFEILTRYRPLFFIDDRPSVCRMWRRRGFTVLQCNDVEF